MNKENEIHEDDEVIVIEQRDKKSLIYIVLALFIGIAAGGLLGASMKENAWSTKYVLLESKIEEQQEKIRLSHNKVEEAKLAVETDIIEQVEVKRIELQTGYEQEVKKLNEVIAELDKLNASLELQLEEARQAVESTNVKKEKLNQQADMQAALYERSRELFQKEVKLKQEVERLTKENQSKQPQLDKLKKECDIYLEGKSWDMKSDVCDRQDALNNVIHQNNQLIEVYKMDLVEIEAISEDLGLTD